MKSIKDIDIVVGCLGLLTVIAMGTVLYLARGVFLPFFFAWILSYMLAPGVRFLTKLRVPVSITTFILLAFLLYLTSRAASFVSAVVMNSSEQFVDYYQRFAGIWHQFAEKYDITANYLQGVDWVALLRSSLIKFSSSMVTIVSKTLLVIVYLIFLLMGGPYVGYKMRIAFPNANAKVMAILHSMSRQIGNFLTVMTAISAATGVLIWLGLKWIGVDFAEIWGLLAFCLNYVPTVGSIIASIPPIIISIVQFYPQNGAAFAIAPQVIATVALILVVQLTLGNVLLPKLMGDTMNLSPVVILTSLLMWGWIWGLAGALLSMPIAGIIKIVCDNVDQLELVGVLMGSGRTYEREFKAAEQQRGAEKSE